MAGDPVSAGKVEEAGTLSPQLTFSQVVQVQYA